VINSPALWLRMWLLHYTLKCRWIAPSLA